MSFYQSLQWSPYYLSPNPQVVQNIRKKSYNDVSTRKDSVDSSQIKYKTEVCKYWLNNQYCPFQNLCSFAHGFQQIRDKSNAIDKYKTKNCKNFTLHGYCNYGMRCQFLHKSSYKIQGKYQKTLGIASVNEQLFSQYFLNLNLKRLNIFKYLSKYDQLKQLIADSINEPRQIFDTGVIYGFRKPRLNSI